MEKGHKLTSPMSTPIMFTPCLVTNKRSISWQTFSSTLQYRKNIVTAHYEVCGLFWATSHHFWKETLLCHQVPSSSIILERTLKHVFWTLRWTVPLQYKPWWLSIVPPNHLPYRIVLCSSMCSSHMMCVFEPVVGVLYVVIHSMW